MSFMDKIYDKLFSKRVTKKELKKNFLLDLSLQIRELIVKHKQSALAVLVGIIIGIIAFAFYMNSYEKKVNEAAKWFGATINIYESALYNQNLSPEERVKYMRESINRFNFIANQFSSTPLADVSLMYQGNAYFELGDYNNAIKKYQELYDKNDDFYFIDLVLIDIGKCYEQLNNIQGAINYYKKVIDEYPESSNAPNALYNLGKIFELANRPNEALQYYQRVLKEYPYSLWTRESKKRILFLQTRYSPKNQK